jgi:hypothetical protein
MHGLSSAYDGLSKMLLLNCVGVINKVDIYAMRLLGCWRSVKIRSNITLYTFKNLNMKNNSLMLAFSFLFLLLAACEKDSIKDESSKPLLPLDTNNSWTYERTTTYGTNSYSTEFDICNIADFEGYTSREYVVGEPISLLKNDKDGNCIEYLFNDNELVYSTILFKNGLKKGDKWNYKAAVFTDGDYSKYEIEEREIKCIVTDSLISTPAGDFICVGFEYHPGGFQSNGDPNHTMIQFLSENIGIVKHMHYEHDNGDTWLFAETVLVDYTVNN